MTTQLRVVPDPMDHAFDRKTYRHFGGESPSDALAKVQGICDGTEAMLEALVGDCKSVNRHAYALGWLMGWVQLLTPVRSVDRYERERREMLELLENARDLFERIAKDGDARETQCLLAVGQLDDFLTTERK